MRPDVVILEDDLFYQNMIRKMVPEDISSVTVGTSEGLKAVLAANPDTRMFILDDQVPSDDGAKPHFHFIKNARAVIETNPNARIVYIGSSPGRDEMKFCKERGIIMMERFEIRSLFEKKDDNEGVDISD